MRELSEQEINSVAGGPVAGALYAAPLASQCNRLSSSTSAMPGLFPASGDVYLSNDPFIIAK